MSDRVKDQLEVFTGNSNPALAREVTEHLGVKMGEAEVGRFPDGEVLVEIRENVRGGDCFVIQSICTPPNENLMELLLMIDALRRASAGRITAVIPYFGYARQDRKVAPRVPISAKVVADLITTAGANRVLTVDLHAGQIQGFFNIPVDNLFAMPVLVNYLRKRIEGKQISVVSPDAGGVERARAFARRLNANLAIIDKRRRRASEVAEHHSFWPHTSGLSCRAGRNQYLPRQLGRIAWENGQDLYGAASLFAVEGNARDRQARFCGVTLPRIFQRIYPRD